MLPITTSQMLPDTVLCSSYNSRFGKLIRNLWEGFKIFFSGSDWCEQLEGRTEWQTGSMNQSQHSCRAQIAVRCPTAREVEICLSHAHKVLQSFGEASRSAAWRKLPYYTFIRHMSECPVRLLSFCEEQHVHETPELKVQYYDNKSWHSFTDNIV